MLLKSKGEKPEAPSHRLVAKGNGWEFWEFSGAVYRGMESDPRDKDGLPMGTRWECTLQHWCRFRHSVFSWAVDSKQGAI